jgi:hypothetical protein
MELCRRVEATLWFQGDYNVVIVSTLFKYEKLFSFNVEERKKFFFLFYLSKQKKARLDRRKVFSFSRWKRSIIFFTNFPSHRVIIFLFPFFLLNHYNQISRSWIWWRCGNAFLHRNDPCGGYVHCRCGRNCSGMLLIFTLIICKLYSKIYKII